METKALPLGELIALATAFTWSLGVFPFTEAAKRLGPNVLNLFRLLVAIILLMITTLLTTDLSFTQIFTIPTYEQWLWLGTSGIIGLAIGDYFGFASFAIIGTRLSTVFTTLAPGAALIFGILINNDTLNAIGIIGMIITIGGVIWLTLSKKDNKEYEKITNYKKGIWFALLAAICQGIGLVFSQKGITAGTQNINAFHISLMRMLIATAGVLLLSFFAQNTKQLIKPVVENKNKGIGYALAGSLLGPYIGMSLSMQAVSMINASVAQTIFSLVPVIVLPLSYLFYKEKISKKAFIGAIIAIIGVFILIWRNAINDYLFN